jgi:hypothetical protein
MNSQVWKQAASPRNDADVPNQNFQIDSEPMAIIGQETVINRERSHGPFPDKKETFEPIAAAQNDLFVGYVGFAIPKRK